VLRASASVIAIVLGYNWPLVYRLDQFPRLCGVCMQSVLSVLVPRRVLTLLVFLCFTRKAGIADPSMLVVASGGA
jgi:hypothetical protein